MAEKRRRQHGARAPMHPECGTRRDETRRKTTRDAYTRVLGVRASTVARGRVSAARRRELVVVAVAAQQRERVLAVGAKFHRHGPVPRHVEGVEGVEERRGRPPSAVAPSSLLSSLPSCLFPCWAWACGQGEAGVSIPAISDTLTSSCPSCQDINIVKEPS
jgi:hypothetical protein